MRHSRLKSTAATLRMAADMMRSRGSVRHRQPPIPGAGERLRVELPSAAVQVKRAAELLRERRPDLSVEGPIQYDAAVDPDVAAVKVRTPVVGRAA